jgi:hypothetical protein
VGGGTIDGNGLFTTDGTPASINVIAVSAIDADVKGMTTVRVYDRVAVLKPGKGDVFEPGSRLGVEWIADTASIRGVTIALSVDSGFAWHDMATVTVSDSSWGYYSFTIPDSVGTGTERATAVSQSCRIRLCKYPSDPPYAFSDGVFSIRQKTGIKQDFAKHPKSGNPIIRNAPGGGIAVIIPGIGLYEVSMFDVKGRLLFKKRGTGPKKISIPAANTFTGACVLRAISDDNIVEKRLVFFH